MTKEYRHKCPACGKFHLCNGRGITHEIYCPKIERTYTILTGRGGRQVSYILQVQYGS